MAKRKPNDSSCVSTNERYPTSHEKWQIYLALPDAAAEKHGLLRIVDESGEDYLDPKAFFRPITLPRSAKRAVLAAAWTSQLQLPAPLTPETSTAVH